MKTSFEEMLTGGHPNSLGNTIKVVEMVLKDKPKLVELFECYNSEDEVVRLRVSNAIKRISKEKPEWVYEHIDDLQGWVSEIDQASTQWTQAQLYMILGKYLTDAQLETAKKIVKKNLEQSDDWIVLNFSMEALTKWSKDDEKLKVWLLPHLEKLSKDSRKSVAKRANKFLEILA